MSGYKETDRQQAAGPEKIDLSNIMRDTWQGIKKLWWLVIGLAVIFAVQSYFSVSSSYQPEYIASATMSVRSAGTTAEYINAQSAEQMAEVFPYILTSGVLEDVIAEDMGMEYVPGVITAKADEGTNLFTLSVSADDPQLAYNILKSVIENYPKVAEFVIGETKLDILDETGIPSDTGRETVIRGSYKRGALKGAVIGLVIMAVYILTRRTVKSRKELRKAINLEDFGSIPYIAEKKRKKSKVTSSVSLLNERVPQDYLEAIRKLRIKVMKDMEQELYKSLLITSSVPGEGKTTLASNLAIAIAKQGKNVILVDCDPRNPSVASFMNEEEKHPGLGAVVRGKVTIEDALTNVEVSAGELKIMYGGAPNEKDSRLLGTRAMREMIKQLEAKADIVILDTAPSELLADAPALAKFVNAALYVVKYDYAKLRQIRDGIQALDMSGVDILGYVFNADQTSRSRGYSYGYSYSYKRYGGYGKIGKFGHYGHYGHYGNNPEVGQQADSAGRVFKD